VTAYSGNLLNVSWVYSGGTQLLTGDQKTFSYTPAIELHDQTAGGDTDKTYITGVKSGQCAFSAIMQTSGTALTVALCEGNSGTLYVGPEGTASTKQKITIPAIALGAKFSMPYADVVEVTCDFTQNGARTDGAFT